jgi:imidazole glycerol-phosphate synthase subunit HisH
MSTIAVIDYGMGNLHSVAKAVERVAPQARVLVTADPGEVMRAERVIFPGQGAMPDCMREMDSRGLRPAVLEAAKSKPFLGLCIGLQMLFDESEEGGVAGLGILPGKVKRFPADRMHGPRGERLKVPHMGWNEVWRCGPAAGPPHPLWAGIGDGARFYFVHSYFVAESRPELAAARSDYGLRFTCAVAQANIFAVQFHPEKSAAAGLTLLGNFVSWQP